MRYCASICLKCFSDQPLIIGLHHHLALPKFALKPLTALQIRLMMLRNAPDFLRLLEARRDFVIFTAIFTSGIGVLSMVTSKWCLLPQRHSGMSAWRQSRVLLSTTWDCPVEGDSGYSRDANSVALSLRYFECGCRTSVATDQDNPGTI